MAIPKNYQKKNCIYALAATRNRQAACTCMLQTRSTFKSVMVSMAVSKLGPMDLVFIDPRVKINGAYYCEVTEVLLTQKLMFLLPEICGEFFIFQQGNFPAHRACETINLLKRDTCVYFTSPFATQQHRCEPNSLQKCGDKCNSGYCKLMMSMN